jgi:hypothetical protein
MAEARHFPRLTISPPAVLVHLTLLLIKTDGYKMRNVSDANIGGKHELKGT